MRTLLKLVFRSLFRVSVAGDIGVLAAGKALIVANHDSYLDAIVLGLFLPARAWIIFGADDVDYGWNRFFVKLFRHRVLDLSQPTTVKRMVRLLDAGELLVMFPQGRVTTTASAMKLYDSVATIALRSGAPVVPLIIDGLLYSHYGRTPGDFPRRRLPRITLRLFGATKLPTVTGRTRYKRRRASDALSAIMQRAAVDARRRETLYEAFLRAVETFGRKRRVVEDIRGKHESYGDLLRTVLALARISMRATAPNEAVGVLLPNLSTTACLLIGLGAVGRIPALLNYTAGPEALRSACTAANIHTVITSRQFIEAGRLYPALDALFNQRILFVEDLRTQFSALDKIWLLAWAMRRPRTLIRASDTAAPAVILFTSGSEARPKAVVLSHDALLSNIAQMRAVIDFSPADRFLNALPMFHSYGLTACTLMPLLCGVGLYIYTTPLRYRVIPEIAYLRDCTFLFGTSTFLGRYGSEAHPYDFYRVRCVISGAEKLAPVVAELWQEKFGLRIFEGYGATECAPVLALNTPLAYKPQSVGRFLPAIEHEIVPVAGIAQGGRLYVRGPNVMLGYYLYDQPGVLQPPQSEAGPGWYDTGDIVDVDGDGFATVLGRVKRFVKIAGEMVALEAVERVAQHASPQHQHAATVEVLAGSGESTVLFTTDPALTRALLQRSAKLLGSQDLAVARRLVAVAELPLLGSGKADYVTLKNLAEITRPVLVGRGKDTA
jgi:acyl-[acyl-carrier-protein]-phospholipid O-acyltransferase/long-chain-fatty-acid--[acyl-carrier-protein] ligase